MLDPKLLQHGNNPCPSDRLIHSIHGTGKGETTTDLSAATGTDWTRVGQEKMGHRGGEGPMEGEDQLRTREPSRGQGGGRRTRRRCAEEQYGRHGEREKSDHLLFTAHIIRFFEVCSPVTNSKTADSYPAASKRLARIASVINSACLSAKIPCLRIAYHAATEEALGS